MAIALSGQNIVISGSGTYTWADVVALGSTNLTTLTTTNGRPSYRWIGYITLSGTTTLNIYDINLELLEQSGTPGTGQIKATGTAIVNIGRKRTVNSQTYYDKSCVITISRTRYTASLSQATEVPIAALSCNPADSSEVNVYGSDILFSDPANISDPTKRIPVYVRALERCNIYSPVRDATRGSMLFSISDPVSCNFTNTDYTKVGSGNISGIGFYNSTLTLYVESATTVSASNIVQNLESAIPTVVAFYTNALDVINSPDYNFSTNVTVYKNGASTPAEYRKLYTHDLSLKSTAGSAISGALCTYTGRTNASATSDGSGNFSQFLLSGLETNFGGYSPQPNGYATYSLPIPTIDYSAYTREIRSYLHEPLIESLTVTSQVGAASTKFEIRVPVDLGVTQANTTAVSAYTGVSHTSSTTTISGARTLAEVYDSRKLYWRNNGGPFPIKTGNVADFGTINVTVSGTLTSVSKFAGGIQSNGVITLASPGSFNAPISTTSGSVILQSTGDYSALLGDIGATGVVTVAPGATTLAGWTFASGATINAASGSATVLVSSATGITAGSGVTLQEPQIRVVAANFANGTRVQVAHRQIFAIASKDINTTTDVLTLGYDSNGDASNFRATSPNTLIRFSLASGATIPASSPQIFDGGLYYWKSGGQLSITEGGTAINFSTQGSGNFVLIAETEIDNSVVSGGAGYAFALTRSNNARIRVKAVHWANPSSIAACSTFYDQVFAWSVTAGISILDTVNNATVASQDSIHEQLIAISSINLEGPVIDATGATITAITLPNDGSAVTGLSLALEGTGKIQINSNDVDGVASWQELYLWGCYVRSTAAGIRLASASTFVANSIFNFTFENLEFDNTSSTPLAIIGGIGRSANGSNPVATTTTGSIALNAVSQGTGAVVASSGGSFNPATDAVIVGSIQASAITANAIAPNAITAAKIATDAIGADKLAADAVAEIWSAATRTLTAGTNISLAKGVGIVGFNDIAAADVWAAATRSLTDKSGFSLSQAFPANFSALAITGGGAVTTGTVTDKTGYSISALPAVPTDWLSAAGVSAAAVTKIQAGLSTYAGGDTPGTSTLLARLTSTRAGYLDNLNFTYAAPDNAAIAAIKAKTDQITFTTANRIDATAIGVPTNPLLANDSRLGNLDAAISSRMATFSYTAPPTVSQIWTSFTSGAVAANLITQFQSGLFQASGYTAPNNAGILSAIAALPQDKIGYSISTLPTPPADWLSAASVSSAAVSKIQSGLSTYAGGDTPGTATLLSRIPGSVLLASGYTAPNNAGILSAIAALPQDKSGYSLSSLPTPPTDWLSAAAVSAAAVSKIQAGLSTYAGGDTPGTATLLSRIPGTVLLASGYTAPDNTAIANINTRTARFDGLLVNPGSGDRFSATALSNTPIGSSLSAADVWAYSDRSLSAGGGTAIAQAVWNFSVDSVTAPGGAGRRLSRLAKIHGLTAASVTASGSGRTTSDGAIAQTITTNPDGSKTMSGAE